jgi:chloramphenicol-sensitive protein RarD
LGGYFIWGLVPLYWKQLQTVNALELIAHRLVWSVVFLTVLITWRRSLPEVRQALGSVRGFALNGLSSLLLTINWLVYVWAVNAGHVIDCSLGYFLVPLLNVALGRFALGERMRRAQAAAVALAVLGVGVQLVELGRLPWVALALAGSFGFYGLLRKQSTLGPLTGLTVETLLLAPSAVLFLLWRQHTGEGALGRVDTRTTLLVLSTGVVTAIPLLLFADGARRLRLTTLGLLQYITPTLQFLIGWMVYHEPFTRGRAVSFLLIWAGLAAYTADLFFVQRRRPVAA